MSLTTHSVHEKGLEPSKYASEDPDAEFWETEARKALEKKLLLKIDLRMSILILIYILNYVRTTYPTTLPRLNFMKIDRSNAGYKVFLVYLPSEFYFLYDRAARLRGLQTDLKLEGISLYRLTAEITQI